MDYEEFSRKECSKEKPFPSPGDLPDPGVRPGSPALQLDSLPREASGKPKIWIGHAWHVLFCERRSYVHAKSLPSCT